MRTETSTHSAHHLTSVLSHCPHLTPDPEKSHNNTHTHTHTHGLTHAHTYVHTRPHPNTHARTHALTQTHTHASTHTHARTHTHTHFSFNIQLVAVLRPEAPNSRNTELTLSRESHVHYLHELSTVTTHVVLGRLRRDTVSPTETETTTHWCHACSHSTSAVTSGCY